MGKLHIKKGKSRVKLAISCALALVCCCGILYSGYNLIIWLQDSQETEEIIGEINNNATVAEVDDNEETKTASEDNKTSLYWRFLNTKLIDVDFNELKNINDETAGWIRVGGTNINYPFVQTSNNDYYLKHNFEKVSSSAGWVFADFRNKLDGNDRNTILYAHGRLDGTMFGTLRTVLTDGWLNNDNNFTIHTSTESVNALWQIFSAYRVPVTNDYIQTDFKSDDEYSAFLNKIKDRSAYDFNVNLNTEDKILTLSTCYSSTERMVLHARLIKWQDK